MTGSDVVAGSGRRADQPSSDAAASSVVPQPIGLKHRAEFQRVARGRRFQARSLSLQAFKRSEAEATAARFGLTVTKKVGNAVERNRIKRRFRDVLRRLQVVPPPGHDYVIVARREALSVPYSGLVADVMKTLDQVRNGRPPGRHGKSIRPTRPDLSP